MGNKDKEPKDIFPTRRFTVHDRRGNETQIIEHDLGDFIREKFGLEKKQQDKPADVIPFKPKT